jgi:hypothetical protein
MAAGHTLRHACPAHALYSDILFLSSSAFHGFSQRARRYFSARHFLRLPLFSMFAAVLCTCAITLALCAQQDASPRCASTQKILLCLLHAYFLPAAFFIRTARLLPSFARRHSPQNSRYIENRRD